MQQAINRNSTNLSLLMSVLCSFLCLKFYSLNLQVCMPKKDCYAYQNSSYLCCINIQENKSYHFKQAQKSISNLSKL